MKKVVVFLPFLVLMACGNKDQKANADGTKPQPEAPAPLAKSANSEAFNTSFQQLLDSYYSLKDGLVKSTKAVDASVDPAANALVKSADSLKLTELKADQSIVDLAKDYMQSISADAKGLVGEKDLEAKRKSFQTISDNLYNLMRTVRYDRQVSYYQYCPMAFNNQGAYWLSKQSEIRNPYFGDKMLDCGETKETLDFTPKQ